MKKQGHTSGTQISISKAIIRRKNLWVGVKVPDALNIGDQPFALRIIKGKRTKGLRCHTMQCFVDKSRIGIVFGKARPKDVFSRNKSLDGKPRFPGTIRKFQSVRPNKHNRFRWMFLIESFRPMRGFVLQSDIFLYRLFGFCRAIHISLRSMIGFGNIIRASLIPAQRMKMMIGGRLGRRRSFLQTIADSHGASGKGLGLHFHQGFFFAPRLGRRMIQMANDPFGRNFRNAILFPRIGNLQDFAGGLFQTCNEFLAGDRIAAMSVVVVVVAGSDLQ
mmetsp:Transcript_87656/g.253148  ORF Transcript_87656/g.253148 Transcript_87656/m.253148 type:complete len:276 (+) Transcript_87656:1635-2462(+)